MFSQRFFQLFDCLKLTLSDPVVNAKTGQIFRNNDDLAAKVTEYERENVKIGAKIFINRACPQQLQEAIDALLNILQVASLDNLILAYHPIEDTEQLLHTNGVPNGINGGGGGSSSSTTLNSDIASFSTTPKENGFLRWGDSDALTDLKQLWKIIEKYANDGKITQLGVADLDHSAFVQLCKTCEIKPTIAQINLSACCVVPPLLQEFCAANDIQLLTHSDPEGMLSPNSKKNRHSYSATSLISRFSHFSPPVVLSRSAFNELESDILNSFKPIWTSRYQVHIRCRGVLTAKGFIVGAERE